MRTFNLTHMYFDDFLEEFPESFSFDIEDVEDVEISKENSTIFGAVYYIVKFADSTRYVEISNAAEGRDNELIEWICKEDWRNLGYPEED